MSMTRTDRQSVSCQEASAGQTAIWPKLCPRLHLCATTPGYPVQSYCLLHRPPGYMIPSIREFESYCSAGRFEECRWFADGSRDGADECGARNDMRAGRR